MIDRLLTLDARLSACSPRTQRLTVVAFATSLACLCLTYVPRSYVSYARIPVLRYLPQPDGYGTDTIADMYEAKVVLHDWRDMYVKAGVAQTALEARTWSKDASAPYPPAALLIEAGLYWLGERTGIGFYGMVIGLLVVLVIQMALYCLETRWHLFPILCVTGVYFAYRFTYVQDATYLIMLVVVMAALELARRRSPWAHACMALAIGIKLSPLYYVKNVPSMSRRAALTFVAVVSACVVVPFAVFSRYAYIFTYHDTIKGGTLQTIGAVVVCVPVSLLLAYVEMRRGFDMEDRVGWGLVPMAMFFAFKMNVARHLLVVLLVPDKRGVRTIASALAVGAFYLSDGLLRINSVLPLATVLLVGGLAYRLRGMGGLIRDDLRHPGRTVRAMVAATRPAADVTAAGASSPLGEMDPALALLRPR